jgi:hypothetical protein
MISIALALSILSTILSLASLVIVLYFTLKRLDNRPNQKNEVTLFDTSSRRAAKDLNQPLVPGFMYDDGMPDVHDPEDY